MPFLVALLVIALIIAFLFLSTLFIVPQQQAYIIENRQEESVLNRNITYEVDPSTVCQFTGLADKNGKEIWEGDYLTPINDSEAMKVIFKEGSFGFDTSYYGMRFHPLAQYDIREGNKLVELILINRKEGEK